MRRHFLVAIAIAILTLGIAEAKQAGTRLRHAPTEGHEAASLTGRLLVATDDLRDPRFHRTVIYMVHHDLTGAMGLVVNRPVGEAPLARLLERLGRSSEGVGATIRVHYGGPVEPGRGRVLHTADWTGGDSQVVRGSVAIDADPAIFDAIAHGTGPRRFIFALRYAGWAPGQLEAEIEHGAWIIVPADEALVFDEDAEGKWERAMARRSIAL